MYKLTDNHYHNLSYFISDLHEDNIYNLDNDPLIQDYKRDLIIKVLDYYNNGNLDFINKENYKEVSEIFLHFGSEIGILFDYYTGIVIKKLNVLKNINLDNNSSKDDYGLVVQFNRDIYNYQNKLKYNKLFNLYFDILQFNIDILDYDNYKIEYIDFNYIIEYAHGDVYAKIEYIEVNSKEELKDYKNNYKLFICFDEELTEEDLGNNLTHLDFYYKYNQKLKENVLPNSLSHLTFDYHNKNINREIRPNVLPQSLTHLTFKGFFNQEIKDNVLPDSLTHLTFGKDYKQEIKENVLPKSLQYIKIKEGLLDDSYINNSNITIEYL
jgi:hypothetical protein